MYLSEEFLRDATERLGKSRATPRLADFLIFKRAAVRASNPNEPSNGALSSSDLVPPPQAPVPTTAGNVVSGMKSPAFQYAIKELTLAVPQDELGTWKRLPYFVAFGYTRDAARGYKSPKYPSNGPDNTAAGWQAQAFTPVALVTGTRPREWAVVGGNEDELTSFLLIASRGTAAPNEKPRMLDAAAWWHRFQDFGQTEPTEQDLIQSFIQAFHLSASEQALFEPLSNEEVGSLKFQPARAPSTAYLPASPQAEPAAIATPGKTDTHQPTADAMNSVAAYVASRGYNFEPWQIAAFITAARTKPFVILAGISGTGKTKLPRLVAEATGASISVVPVQPSWNDSSDLLGYERLNGDFVPGHFLKCAQSASSSLDKEHLFLLDEMNIARPEYYMAELLSAIEERKEVDGHLRSEPLLPNAKDPWNGVALTDNLCIVGSVNMDETTFSFSRKVLDRSFVIEFSDIDLGLVKSAGAPTQPESWPAEWWQQPAKSLPEHPNKDAALVAETISELTSINEVLLPAQLQVGYRARDEIVMFVLNADPYRSSFVTDDASPVDPLDLAICMKILPRIQGGGGVIQGVITNLLDWANGGPSSSGRSFPICAERLAMMLDRLTSTGFTSYWL